MGEKTRLHVGNNVETTLAEDISDTDNTIEITDASDIPDTPVRLTISDENNLEIIEVGGVNREEDILEEVTRGTEDTEAQSFDTGDTVDNRFTAGTYNELVGEEGFDPHGNEVHEQDYISGIDVEVEDEDEASDVTVLNFTDSDDFTVQSSDDTADISLQESVRLVDVEDSGEEVASVEILDFGTDLNVSSEEDKVVVDADVDADVDDSGNVLGGSAEEEDAVAVHETADTGTHGKSIAIGSNALTTEADVEDTSGLNHIVIGENSQIEANSDSFDSAIAIGKNAYSEDVSLAIGKDAEAEGISNVALGYQAETLNGTTNVAIGENATVDGDDSVSIGSSTDALDQSVIIGDSAEAAEQNSIVIGTNSAMLSEDTSIDDEGYNSVVLGNNVALDNHEHWDSVYIGNNLDISNDARKSVVIGERASTAERRSIVIGSEAEFTGITGSHITIGQGLTNDSTNGSLVIANNTDEVSTNQGVAVGHDLDIDMSDSGIYYGTSISYDGFRNNYIVGYDIQAGGDSDGSVVLGGNIEANGAHSFIVNPEDGSGIDRQFNNDREGFIGVDQLQFGAVKGTIPDEDVRERFLTFELVNEEEDAQLRWKDEEGNVRTQVVGGEEETTTTVSENYTTTGETTVFADVQEEELTVTLSSEDVRDGKIVRVMDKYGNADENNIMIETENDETINGVNSTTIDGSYESLKIQSDGSDWFIVGRMSGGAE